ncbi:MAG: phosphotransferase [Caldisericia bacterium]
MKKIAYDDWNEEIYKKSLALFGVDINKTKEHGAFESFVFDGANGTENLIIKATHNSSRKKEILLGQIEWMDYLHKNGVPVTKPKKSVNGNFIETIDAKDGEFYITGHIKAEGKPLKEAALTESLTFQYGKITGRIHKLTKNFEPNLPGSRLQHWHEDEQITNLSAHLPDDEKELKSLHSRIREKLLKIDTNPRDYGFIHTDLHTGNLIFNNDQIFVIDFFDSMYYWFAYDIAVIFYYLRWLMKDIKECDQRDFIKNFAVNFLKGYNSESKFEKSWIGTFNLFLRTRDLELLTVLFTQKGTKEYDKFKEWIPKFRERVLNEDKEIIELDEIFSEIIQ